MKKNTPLISVVMPVFNCGEYIAEAMQSIFSQTIQDFEFIIINDGSNDNTLIEIEKYTDCRIVLLNNKTNKGLIHCLNLGFKIAKGEYIARMDADDISIENRFELQLEILRSNENIVACGSWIQYLETPSKIIKHPVNHSDILIGMLSSNSMSLGCCMLKSKIAKEFRFNPEFVHAEDYEFWSRLVWRGELYNIPKVLYYYRKHDNQVSHKFKGIQIEQDVKIKIQLLKHIKYSDKRFPPELINKIFSFNQFFSLREFWVFLSWLNYLIKSNNNDSVFPKMKFEKFIDQKKKWLISKIYFYSNEIGINKIWKLNALLFLPLRFKIIVCKYQIRQRIKILGNLLKINVIV